MSNVCKNTNSKISIRFLWQMWSCTFGDCKVWSCTLFVKLQIWLPLKALYFCDFKVQSALWWLSLKNVTLEVRKAKNKVFECFLLNQSRKINFYWNFTKKRHKYVQLHIFLCQFVQLHIYLCSFTLFFLNKISIGKQWKYLWHVVFAVTGGNMILTTKVWRRRANHDSRGEALLSL